MKMFKTVFIAIVLCFMVGCLTSCYNGNLCYVDNSVTQTNNIGVSVLSIDRKAFVYGADSEKRISKFGPFGELVCVNIKISGKTTLDRLKETTTGMTSNGVATNNEADVSYFTDWVKIKIRLPQNYALINTLNGKGNVKIDKAKQVEDGYYTFNFEWVTLDKSKGTAHLSKDDNENDKYLFFEFSDKNENVLEQYFVHIVYDVKID